jgi:hypothetical protein
MSTATDRKRLHATAVRRKMGERIAASHKRKERMLEALLTLSQRECGDSGSGTKVRTRG